MESGGGSKLGQIPSGDGVTLESAPGDRLRHLFVGFTSVVGSAGFQPVNVGAFATTVLGGVERPQNPSGDEPVRPFPY